MDGDGARPDDPRSVGDGRGGNAPPVVGGIREPQSGTLLGTCFPFESPRIFLTAAHVFEGRSASDLSVLVPGYGSARIGRATSHTTMDLAVALMRPSGFLCDGLACFQLADPPDGLEFFPETEPITTFGYSRTGKDHPIEFRQASGSVCGKDEGSYLVSCSSRRGHKWFSGDVGVRSGKSPGSDTR